MTVVPTAPTLKIYELGTLSLDPELQAHVVDRHHQALREGRYPDRPAPDGDSQIIYCRDPAGEVVAFTTYYETDGGSLWLDVLWIEEAWRRKGVATVLLNIVMADAIAGGLKSVMLGHLPDNEAMAVLMTKAGWPVDHVVRIRKV